MNEQRPYRLGLLLGDGIGPEIVPAAATVLGAALAAAGAPQPDWVRLPLGAAAITTAGSPTPATTLDALAGLDGWLLGPHDSAAYPEPFRDRLNPSGTIRRRFDLYANIRPARALPGGRAVHPGIDLVIVRENTEGFYADRNTHAGGGELMPTPDVALAVGIVTRAAVTRIARTACALARRRRRRLTIVHKANVLRLTMGLFRDVCREVAAEFPDLAADELHADAAAAALVRRAAEFDVLVTENLVGDILSDLAGEVAGSLGVAGSVNASDRHAMAQAAHGSAPDIAGRGVANPIAMIRSAALLLDWLADRHGDQRLRAAAGHIEDAIATVVAAGVCTPDLGGSATTDGFTAEVVNAIAAAAPAAVAG